MTEFTTTIPITTLLLLFGSHLKLEKLGKVKERNREVHTLILTSTCTYIHQIKEPIRREGKWQKPFCFCFTELLSVIIQAFNGWSGVELIWVVWDK